MLFIGITVSRIILACGHLYLKRKIVVKEIEFTERTKGAIKKIEKSTQSV